MANDEQPVTANEIEEWLPSLKPGTEHLANRLVKEHREVRRQLLLEGHRRVYYQNIVYYVCRKLEEVKEDKGGVRVVCGMASEPSTEVQEQMAALVEEVKELRKKYNDLHHDLTGKMQSILAKSNKLQDENEKYKKALERIVKMTPWHYQAESKMDKIESIALGALMSDPPRYCPKCNTDLKGSPIPKDAQHLFGDTHFSRLISIYSREKDRTVAWRCPACGHEWER